MGASPRKGQRMHCWSGNQSPKRAKAEALGVLHQEHWAIPSLSAHGPGASSAGQPSTGRQSSTGRQPLWLHPEGYGGGAPGAVET